jgi:hypothetical protein
LLQFSGLCRPNRYQRFFASEWDENLMCFYYN